MTSRELGGHVRWLRRIGIAIAIACACACGGHDKAPAPSGEPASANAYAIGDPGTCPSITMTATGSSPGSWSGPATSFSVPETITIASGATTGSTLTLGWFYGDNSPSCTYVATDVLTFTWSSCFDGDSPDGGAYSATSASLTLTSGSTATVTLNLSTTPLTDGNPCTTDKCTAGGGVTHTPVPAGTPCSDGDVCNGTETCNSSGACIAGTPVPTTSPNPCFAYAGCNATTGPYYTSTGTCSTPTGYSSGSFDSTIATNLVNSASFLWSGRCTCTSSSQPGGCAATCINLPQVSVVRGRVLSASGGSPVAGATIAVLNHPEASATTRSDGWYDIAVNGGGPIVLEASMSGYPPVHRHVKTKWHEYSVVPDLYLTPLDTHPTSVTLGSASYQTVHGSTFTNSSDTTNPATTPRTGRLLMPPSTGASFTYGPCPSTGSCASGQTCNTTTNLCTGSASSSLTTRITEFTVGSTGPASMPAELPTSTGYTYAVELSADEATAAGASGISFTNPVVFYVENFLGYPSGYDVPVGWYARYSGSWVTAPDGQVITITSLATSGCAGGYSTCAVLDAASSGFGIGAAELNQLALMYSTSTFPLSLQRVAMTHFTAYDLNPPPSGAPVPPPPPPPFPSPPPPNNNPCVVNGSIIECENQILAQQLPLVGTPYSLRYQSNRAKGAATLSANIPLTGATLPSSPSLAQILVAITVAGVTSNYTYNPPFTTNQSLVWTWDRLDAYGNTVQGQQNADVDITYVFPPSPYAVVSCGSGTCNSFSNFPASGAASSTGYKTSDSYEFVFHSSLALGVQDAETLGLGGWTLSANHLYDPASQTLWLGDGSRENLQTSPQIIQSVAGTVCSSSSGDGGPALNATFQTFPVALAAAPDNSFYVTDHLAVRYVNSLGVISHVAGNGMDSGPCTGPCAASTSSVNPNGLAVGPDGSVYISSFSPNVVQKVDTSGILTTIAGQSGTACVDGPLGTNVLGQVAGIAMAPDGSIVIADEQCSSVRRLRPDGTLVTLNATSGCSGDSGNGGPIGAACVLLPLAVAVAPDGTIYFADSLCIVRAIDPHTGFVSRLGGGFPGGGGYACAPGGAPPSSYNGAPATSMTFGTIRALTVGADGTLYVADFNGNVWRIDPITDVAYIVAGGTSSSPPNTSSDNGGPAFAGYVPQSQSITALPNGSILEGDNTCRVRAIQSSFPAYAPGTAGIANTYIPSKDGSQIFGFDPSGRHMATFDGTTGAQLLTFAYNSSNQLTTATDINSNVTSIARSGSTSVTFTPPFGQPSSQQTTMALNPAGNATSITNPNSEQTQFTYSGGLMKTMTTPAGNLHTFIYDPFGQLLTDEEPTGSTQYLTRTLTTGAGLVPGLSWSTAILSGGGFTTRHAVGTGTNGTITQTTTFPSGATASRAQSTGDVITTTAADGTITATTRVADPRFGLLDPYPGTVTVTTPSGLTKTTVETDTATLGSPPNALTPTALGKTITVNTTSTSTANYASSTSTWTYTSAMGRVMADQLDSEGRVVQVSYPSSSLAPTTYTYPTSLHGRLSQVSTTSGSSTRTTSLAYDTVLPGYLYTSTDPVGNVTTYAARDGAGRVTDVQLPNFSSHPKSTYAMTYDLDGNLASLTVPPATSYSSEHVFSNNNLDLLGIYEPPTGGLGSAPMNTTYTYNADSLLQSVAVPHMSGTDNVTYLYDPNGRLSAVLDGLSGIAREYGYNARDQVTSLATTDGTTLTNVYDGFLLKSVTWSGAYTNGSVGFTFDDFFRVAQRTVNSGTAVVNTYDADSLFTGTTSPATFNVTRGYTSYYGRVTGTTLGSVSDAWTYDGFGELLTYTVTSGSTTLYAMSGVTRNKNGQINAMTEQINGATYTWGLAYDPLGRLTSVTRTASSSEPALSNAYTYDPNGNRLTLNTGSYTYDVEDRLTAAPSGVSFTYTHDGTLLKQIDAAGTRNVTYDLEGVLQSVTLESGDVINYHNDGLQRRVGHDLTWGTPTSQQFLYDDQLRIAAELSGSTVKSVFVYGTKPNVPDYMWQPGSGKAYRIVSDQLGSVRLVLDTTTTPATVIQQLDYDEFGNLLAGSFDTTCASGAECFPLQPFGFAGGLQDRDTGMVRFGARDYLPLVGRWVSKDPIRFDASSDYGGPWPDGSGPLRSAISMLNATPGTTNLYLYVLNDPINARDMSGRAPGDGGDPSPVPGGGDGPNACYYIPNPCWDSCSTAARDFYNICIQGFDPSLCANVYESKITKCKRQCGIP